MQLSLPKKGGAISFKGFMENIGDTGRVKTVGFSVSDNGPGIAKEKLEKIFDRFKQGDDTSSRKYEGTGLGLAIVQEFSHLHQGHISVTSDEGVGTTFTFVFPGDLKSKDVLQFGQDEADDFTVDTLLGDISSARIQSSQAEVNLPEGAPHVLLVDDNDDLRVMVGNELSKSYYVSYAKNGKKALDQVRSVKPDIIILDQMMPELDGAGFLKKFRSYPPYVDVPVIMATAKTRMDHLTNSL